MLEKHNVNIVNINNNIDKEAVWKVEPSLCAATCKNYIREVVDNLNLEPNPEKPVIPFSLGDPTVFGNLKPAPETIEAVQKALLDGKYNGYAPSVGFEDARQAVAKYMEKDGLKLTAKDIILCSGGSSCLDLCITALADGTKHHNILIPRPAFPIYRTLAANVGVAVKRYNLIPENNWEIDLDHLESQIDSNTAAVIITNPSNPCGSNFSEEHLKNVLEICYRRKVPVIADEIYENVVFPGEKFISTGSLNSGVPILICAGLTKRFLVPGWRMGWIAVCDTPNGALEHVRKGLISLSQRILGPNTLIQAALPDILQNTPQSFHDSVINQLKSNVDIMFDKIKQCKGLTPIMPQGALYLTVEIEQSRFPEFKDGMEFTRRMMEEESVFCLPGDCFEAPGFMRLVTTLPQDLITEACERIQEFCNRHFV